LPSLKFKTNRAIALIQQALPAIYFDFYRWLAQLRQWLGEIAIGNKAGSLVLCANHSLRKLTSGDLGRQNKAIFTF